MKVLKLLFVVLIMLLFFGCFQKGEKNEEKTNLIGEGVKLVKQENNLVVLSETVLLGAEYSIYPKVSNENIVTDNLFILNNDGKKSLLVIASDAELSQGSELFKVKNVGNNMVISQESVIKENDLNVDRSIKRSVPGEEKLLGDFDANNKVDISDFYLFEKKFNNSKAYDASYDISPADKADYEPFNEFYCFCYPDGVVGIRDFVIFAKNYGKSVTAVTKPVSISVTGTASIFVGDTTTYAAKVEYSDGSSKTESVDWSSDNESAATVDSNGKVTGKAKGSSKIIASKGNLSGSKTITVNTKETIKGIKLYSKLKTIWAWTDAKENMFTDWPGETMNEGENGWYWYHFEDHTSMNVIFSDGGQGKTDDLKVESEGHWWYFESEWHNVDPDIDIYAPEVKSEPAQGRFEDSSIQIKLVAEDAHDKNAKVYYTKDGTTPKEEANYLYSSPFTVSGTGSDIIVKAFGTDIEGNVSDIYTFKYTLGVDATAPEVKANPEPGKYSDPVSVKLTITDAKDSNPKFYYTTNGEEATTSSKLYGGESINIDKRTTIKGLAVDKNGNEKKYNLFYAIGDIESGDFREETVYFLMPSRYYDGDSSNNRYQRVADNGGNRANNDPGWRGDIKGLIQKLDYIKALGFSAIWITPPVLNRSDADYHGYHAWDMSAIDGRLLSEDADYQDLIDEMHKRDMKLMQDIVLNHSSRYGEKNLNPPMFWGDSNDPDWGAGTKMDYYDAYNPDFEYDGVSIEPNSGKNFYNGDRYSPTAPTDLWWNPDLSQWGKFHHKDHSTGLDAYWYQFLYDGDESYAAFDPDLYHTSWLRNWEDYTCQSGSIHGDCLDLNTENEKVQKYLIDVYTKYINMGVDAFRIDTTKHISRVMFNRHFVPAFKKAGGENFYMAGEALTKVFEVWNKGNAPLSAPFYTWKERKEYSEDDVLAAQEGYDYEYGMGTDNQPSSDNHYLDGNNYREPDYTKASGLSVIDCHMHVNFAQASSAFGVRGNDHWYNDATYNLVYVDSHDYGPSTSGERYAGGTGAWAENISLMMTWRGIPTIYYGSEIEFKAGAPVDGDPNKLALANSGRAYFGDEIEGDVEVEDFGVWKNATGAMANALKHPLAVHIARVNRIRRAVPALQKGQYSTDGVDGHMAYKKRFTDKENGIDSFALITVSGGATFNGVPDGKYVDCVTGDVKQVSGGTLSADCSGQGNLRVYVLDLPGNPAPGKIGEGGQFLK